MLYGLCLLAGIVAAATLLEVGYQVISGASPAISRFGPGFLAHTQWAPNFDRFGAATMLFGTAVTSLIAMAISTAGAASIFGGGLEDDDAADE